MPVLPRKTLIIFNCLKSIQGHTVLILVGAGFPLLFACAVRFDEVEALLNATRLELDAARTLSKSQAEALQLHKTKQCTCKR